MWSTVKCFGFSVPSGYSACNVISSHQYLQNLCMHEKELKSEKIVSSSCIE